MLVVAGGRDIVGAFVSTVERNLARGNQLEIIVMIAASGRVRGRPPNLAAPTSCPVNLDRQHFSMMVIVMQTSQCSLVPDKII